MLRRSLSFVVTVVVTLVLGYQLAWHRHSLHTVFAHPWQTLGWLVAVAITVYAFVSVVRKQHQNPWRKAGELAAAIAFGAIAAVNFQHIFAGFNGWFVLGLFGSLVGLVILWWLTTSVKLFSGKLLQDLPSRPGRPNDPIVPGLDDDAQGYPEPARIRGYGQQI